MVSHREDRAPDEDTTRAARTLRDRAVQLARATRADVVNLLELEKIDKNFLPILRHNSQAHNSSEEKINKKNNVPASFPLVPKQGVAVVCFFFPQKRYPYG